ncbi:MAG: transposase [Minisyncoccia bacterium]
MRIEPYGIGSIRHITQRGVRGLDIMRDVHDRDRSVRGLFYLNDTYADANWHRQVLAVEPFSRPLHWPERDPLVRILAWTFLSNHFHILLQELREGGTAKFMQRFCGSMSSYFNVKYREKGGLFQGSYHARTVTEDEHYRYLAFYILVKNVLEMYPGGLRAAQANFDDAWEWAKWYPYSSLRDSVATDPSPIIDDPDGLIKGIIGTGDAYKQEARELFDFHMASRGEEFKALMLEPW